MSTPFEYLAQLQLRCQQHAVGLPTKEKVDDDWVGIGFSSQSIRCIVQMSEVTEILPVPETIRVPGVKKWVKGLANVRGALMPVLDLRGYLVGGTTKINKHSRILIVDQAGVLAGILVEEVFGLRRFKQGTQRKNTSNQLRDANMERYITGEFLDKNEQWNIFSMKTLLTTDTFLRVV